MSLYNLSIYLTYLFMRALLGKSSPGQKISNISLCGSTIQLLQCLARSEFILPQDLYFAPPSSPINLISECLPVSIVPQDFSRVVFCCLWARLRGFRPRVWVAFIVPTMFETKLGIFGFNVFKRLQAAKILDYYDDGLSAITRKSVLFQRGFISADAFIHTWDYAFLEQSEFYHLLISRSKINYALRFVSESLPSVHPAQPGSSVPLGSQHDSGGGKQKIVVIASKSIDYPYLLDWLDSKPQSSLYYIPHYQAFKNCSELLAMSNRLQFPIVELGLFNFVSRHECTIFVGVTSTIVFLFELIIRSPRAIPLKVVFMAKEDLCGSGHVDEFRDFYSVLKFYSTHPPLLARGVSLEFLHA